MGVGQVYIASDIIRDGRKSTAEGLTSGDWGLGREMNWFRDFATSGTIYKNPLPPRVCETVKGFGPNSNLRPAQLEIVPLSLLSSLLGPSFSFLLEAVGRKYSAAKKERKDRS